MTGKEWDEYFAELNKELTEFQIGNKVQFKKNPTEIHTIVSLEPNSNCVFILDNGYHAWFSELIKVTD